MKSLSVEGKHWRHVTQKTSWLLLCIFSVEIIKATFVLFLPTHTYGTLLLFIFYALQIACAPIQGAFSDKYCRKSSILISLGAILIAQGFLISSLLLTTSWLSHTLLIMAIFLYGSLGNADVISRAGIIDLFQVKDKAQAPLIKIAISLSFMILPIAWVLIANLRLLMTNLTLCIALPALTICSFLLVKVFFRDKRDFDSKVPIKSLYKFIKTEHFGVGFLGFLLAETAFQLSYLFQNNVTSRRLENFYTIGFASGMLFGAIWQVLSKKKDSRFVLSGILQSTIAMALLFLSNFLNFENRATFFLFYLYFTVGSGLYLPRFYILYSKGHQPHEQGKLFGLLDSLQTIGEVAATVVLFASPSEQFVTFSSIIIFVFALFFLKMGLPGVEKKVSSP